MPDTMTPAQAWLVALADSWLDEMVLAQVMSLVLRHDLEPRLYRKRG